MPISAILAASRSRSPGSAWCCRRWSSTISGRARCAGGSAGDREPVLPAVPDWALFPIVSGDGGDSHRQPGRDHRRVFADAQAIQLGLLPRIESAHVRDAFRTDLHSAGQRCSSSACCCWSSCSARPVRWPRPMALRSQRRWWSTADRLHRDLEALGWPAAAAAGGAVPGRSTSLLSANLLKLFEGAWVPLLFGGP